MAHGCTYLAAQEIEEYIQAITPAIIRDEKYLEAFPLQDQLHIPEKLKKEPIKSREVLLKIYRKIIVSPESIELHINRAGILNLIHGIVYGAEGAFAGEETDIITKAIRLKKVNHGDSLIRGEVITSGANPQRRERRACPKCQKEKSMRTALIKTVLKDSPRPQRKIEWD